MKTNHSKHSGFFQRQLKITISIRRQTHYDFQLRNISLGLNNARYVFQLTIPDIFLDDSWSLRRENASVGDRGRLPLGLCRVSTSEKKNTHLTNKNTMAFTNTKMLASQMQIQWHSQIQNNNSHYNYKIIHKYVQNQWTHSNACFKDVIKSFCVIL